MSQENLHNLQENEHDTTQIYGDKDMQSQINSILRTLDRVAERLSVIKVQTHSARQSRMTPLSTAYTGATVGYNPVNTPHQANSGARSKSQSRDQFWPVQTRLRFQPSPLNSVRF